MKIRTRRATLAEALAKKRPAHKDPRKPNLFFRTLIRVLAHFDLKKTHFSFTKSRMEAAGDGPYLILMNHSSFIDLEIAYAIFYPKPMCIVCTSDGFVGKEWLMRALGCIPTQKFVSDITLIRDMQYTLQKKKTSVLMFPEASYTFDGTTTPLPRKMGILLKKLGVPVLTVMTEGAFLHDPLYNGLQKRRTKVSAQLTCLFSREELAQLSVEALDQKLDAAFAYDHFARQWEARVAITEPFRADGLHRILYRCAACGAEGHMCGQGVLLSCQACGKTWEMDEYGRLAAKGGGAAVFPHIPDWYAWERQCVRQALQDGSYRLDVPVQIGVMTDYRAIYMVGEGRLFHDAAGFRLYDETGACVYTQSPIASYSLYADYYWYEIDDVICIGNRQQLFYCFPTGVALAAKTRLAAEELYKMCKAPAEKTTTR